MKPWQTALYWLKYLLPRQNNYFVASIGGQNLPHKDNILLETSWKQNKVQYAEIVDAKYFGPDVTEGDLNLNICLKRFGNISLAHCSS